MLERKLVNEGPASIGGHSVISCLPSEYSGPCRIETLTGELVAVLPDPDKARSVAFYAVSPDGGYGAEVEIWPADTHPVSHENLSDFISRI